MPGRTEIVAEDAPRGGGAYSQAVRAGDFVFVSGQGPLDPRTLQVRGDTIQEQTEHTLRNVRAIAEAAGGTLGDVVKVSAFLSSIDDFAAALKSDEDAAVAQLKELLAPHGYRLVRSE